MAFGGLDLEALRSELNAARQERVALLQQAADLDSLSLAPGGAPTGLALAAPLDGFQGFPAASQAAAWGATPTAADALSRGPSRKLSWGTPRAPSSTTTTTTTIGLATDDSVYAPGYHDGWSGGWAHSGAAGVGAGVVARPRGFDDDPGGSDSEGDGEGDGDEHVRASFAFEGPTALASAPSRPLLSYGNTNVSAAAGAVVASSTAAAAALAAALAAVQGGGAAGGPGVIRAAGTPPLASSPQRQTSGPQDPVAGRANATLAAAGSGGPPSAAGSASTSAFGSNASSSSSGGSTARGLGSGSSDGGTRDASAAAGSGTGVGPGQGGLESATSNSRSQPSPAQAAVAAPAPAAIPPIPPVKLAGAGGGGGVAGGLTIPLKLGSSGFGGIAAAASRAAAAAATVATTGQPAVPWAAHHTHNAAGAGVDLEAHRRMVVREVLAAVLGEPPNSAKLEHMRLDVESVAAIVRQRTTDAAAAAGAEVEERLKGGQAERQAKALRAAEEKGERALAELKRTMEEEKRRLQSKLDKFRGQLADAEKEKKSLSGKSGQQNRELKETKEALMLSKQLLSTAQNTAEVKAKALAKAQAELERLRAEAEAASEARGAEVAAARAQAEAARQEAAAQAEAEVARVRAEAEATAAAAAEAAASAAAEAQAGSAALTGAVAEEVEGLVAAAAALAGAVEEDLAAAGEDMAGLKSDLETMRADFRTELAAMREAAYAAIGGFHAACRTAAQAHAERAAQLLGMDEPVRKLGPGGVAALLAELEALRGQLAEGRARVERLEREGDLMAAAQLRATADAEARLKELQAATAAKEDLASQLSAARSELFKAMGECEQLRQAAEGLRAQLRKAQDDVTAHREAALRGDHSQQREAEAAQAAAQRALAEAEAARREVKRWQEAAAEAVAAGRHEAVVVATTLLTDLRDRYFETLSGGGVGGDYGGRRGDGGEGGEGEGEAAMYDSEDRGGPSELETAVGFRLYDVVPERLAAALETYLSRQAAMEEGRGDREASPTKARTHGSGSSPARQRPGDLRYQPHPTRSSGAAAAGSIMVAAAGGGWQRPLVSEVLWLEGCLLAAQVDLRLGPGSGGREIRALIGQLVRGVVSERQRLHQSQHYQQQQQPRGRHLPLSGGGGGGGGTALSPYLTNAGGGAGAGGARRTLNATAPSSTRGSNGAAAERGGNWRSSGGGSHPEPPAAALPPPPSARQHGLTSYGNAGVADPEAAATPRAGGQRRGGAVAPLRNAVRRSTDTDAVLGAAPALPYGAAATEAGGLPSSECMLPPLPNPYSIGQGPNGSPLQAPDMDELMDVLQALDDSSLRRSRGAPLTSQARRQGAWTALDSPGSAAPGGPGDGRRAAGPSALGTPPKGPSKGAAAGATGVQTGGGGYDTALYGGQIGGRSMGRAVSWSGPGGGGGGAGGCGGGIGAGGGGGAGGGLGSSPGGGGMRPSGRVSSADVDATSGGKRGSPYLGPSGGGRVLR